MQRDRTVGEGQETVVEPEKAGDSFGFALSHDGGWRVQRDEKREHLAAKALVEREVTPDCDGLIVRMGGNHKDALLLNRAELDGHAVRNAVNLAQEAHCRVLKYAVEE
jgi:hypothetical protein